MLVKVITPLAVLVLCSFGAAPHVTAGAGDSGTRAAQATPLWQTQRVGEPHQGLYSSVYKVALSPDGRRAVSAGGGPLRIWDTATGEPIGTLRNARKLAVQSGDSTLAWSTDSNAIAVGTVDGLVMLWDARTRDMLWQIRTGKDEVTALGFDRKGSRIATANSGDKAIRIWDRADGKELGQPMSGHRDRITDFVFADDGRTLISAGMDNTIRIWDIETGRESRQPVESKAKGPRHLALSPKGNVLAASSVFGLVGGTITAGSGGGAIEFWDLKSGQPAAAPVTGYGETYGITGIAFTEDGDKLMVGDSFGGLALIDWRTGRLTAQGVVEHHDVIVYQTVFSPKGDLIVTAGKDGVVGIWSGSVLAGPAPLTMVPRQEHTFGGALPLFSADGSLVAYGRENRAIVEDLASNKILLEASLGDRATAMAISGDGLWLAASNTGGVGTHLWHIPTKRSSGEWRYPAQVLSFSPDATRLAIGYYSSIVILDRASGRELGRYQIGTQPHSSVINALVFAPDGKVLIAATRQDSVYRLDASTLRPIGEPWPGLGQFGALAFDPDGRRLAVARALPQDIHQVVVLDAARGTQWGEPMTGHVAIIQTLVFTPDGRYLLTAGGDGVVSLWDSATSERLGRVKLWLQGSMRGFRFTRDMKRFSACNMGTYTKTECRVWDVSIHVPDRQTRASVARVPEPIAPPVAGHVAELAIQSLSNAIELSSSRLILDTSREPLAFANHGTIRFIGGSSITAARELRPATIFENTAISPDGRHATVELADKQLAVFEIKTGKLLTVVELPGYESVHVFLSDGMLALDWGHEGIRIVAPANGAYLRTLRRPPEGNVTVLAASEKAPLIVIGTSEGTLSFGRTDKPSMPFRVVERAHRGGIVSITFSPDGRRVASGGLDGRVRLFDAETGNPIGAPWVAHARAVTAIGFSPDGRQVASGSTDGTVRVWDAQSGRPLTLALVGHTEPVLGLSFDPANRKLLSFGRDRKLRSWDIASLPGTARTSAP